MTIFTTDAPLTCPYCKEPTDEVNISVNISVKDCEGNYTGDTIYGDKLPVIGSTCRDCGIEWINATTAQEALAELLLVEN